MEEKKLNRFFFFFCSFPSQCTYRVLFRLINGTKRETATARPNTLLVNQENRFVPTDYLSFRRPSRARSLEKKTNKTQTTPVDRTLLARIRLRTCNCRRDVTRSRVPTLHGRSSGPTSEKKNIKTFRSIRYRLNGIL